VQYCSRVRVKGNHCRNGIRSARTLDHSTHHKLVPQMKTVKYAQRQNRRTRNLRIIRSMKKAHKEVMSDES
jgi:hypothetical protein